MFHAGCLLVNAFTCSAETVNRVAEDFNAFMVKDEESETGRAAEQPPSTLPPSLRKLLHILQSPEAALAAGNLVRGALGLAPSPAGAPTSLLESALGALGSEKGQTLLTCVVGRAAREAMGSLVDAVFANLQSSFASDAGLDRVLHDVFAALDAPHARGLLLDALSALVSAAVSSYIEKTASMHINVADTLITSMMKVRAWVHADVRSQNYPVLCEARSQPEAPCSKRLPALRCPAPVAPCSPACSPACYCTCSLNSSSCLLTTL